MLDYYQSDDVTPAEDLAIPDFVIGATSTAVEIHAWNSKGTPAAQPLTNVLLLQQVEDPDTAGVWLASGKPPLDELWAEVRIIGYNNSGDSSWSLQTTDWHSLGAYSPLLIGTIPGDCAVHLEWRLVVPSNATAVPWTFRLSEVADLFSRPVPPLLAHVRRGVLTFTGDPGHSEVLSGCAVTPNAPADDQVNLAAGIWQFRGRNRVQLGSAFTLDQNDGAAAALSAGEHYLAHIVLGDGTATALKGNKGTAPDPPSLAAWEISAGLIRVEHQPGGTSVLDAAAIQTTPAYGRYLCTPGAGLDATLSPGQAVAGGSWRYQTGETQVSLTDAATNRVWQAANGGFVVTTTAAPPSENALLLWELDTAGGVVTATRDVRPFLLPPRPFSFRALPTFTGGSLGLAVVEEAELQLEGIVLHADHTGATAGATTVDVTVNGVSAFVTSANPSVAWNASPSTDAGAVPEIVLLKRGDVVEATVTAVATGGNGASVVELITRAG